MNQDLISRHYLCFAKYSNLFQKVKIEQYQIKFRCPLNNELNKAKPKSHVIPNQSDMSLLQKLALILSSLLLLLSLI